MATKDKTLQIFSLYIGLKHLFIYFIKYRNMVPSRLEIMDFRNIQYRVIYKIYVITGKAKGEKDPSTLLVGR